MSRISRNEKSKSHAPTRTVTLVAVPRFPTFGTYNNNFYDRNAENGRYVITRVRGAARSFSEKSSSRFPPQTRRLALSLSLSPPRFECIRSSTGLYAGARKRAFPPSPAWIARGPTRGWDSVDAAAETAEIEQTAGTHAGPREYGTECNKEMRIFLHPFMRRQDHPLPRSASFARALRRDSPPSIHVDVARRVIRNRCLFYETFYLAAQPAFQYFARFSRLVHDLSLRSVVLCLRRYPPAALPTLASSHRGHSSPFRSTTFPASIIPPPFSLLLALSPLRERYMFFKFLNR